MKLVAVLAGVALLGATPALAASSKKTVRVGDNFFSPKKLTVDRNSTVTWKWPGFRRGGGRPRRRADLRPKSMRSSQSEATAAEHFYKRKLTKSGTYKLVCTLHEEMRMTIKVRS